MNRKYSDKRELPPPPNANVLLCSNRNIEKHSITKLNTIIMYDLIVFVNVIKFADCASLI